MTGKGRGQESASPSKREYAPAPPPIPLTITPRAREALIEVLRLRPRGCVVHLSMSISGHPHPRLAFRPAGRGETVFEQSGLPFVVDEESRPYLSGATIDHVVEGGFASFEIEGPQLPRAPGGAPEGSES